MVIVLTHIYNEGVIQMNKHLVLDAFSCSSATPAAFAYVDELVLAEKQDAASLATKANEDAQKAFDEAKGKDGMAAKWEAYTKAKGAFDANEKAIADAKKDVEKAEKDVKDNKDDAKKDALNKAVEAAKTKKTDAEKNTADLKKAFDAADKEVKSLIPLDKAFEVAKAKLAVATAEVTHFLAESKLTDCKKAAEKAKAAIPSKDAKDAQEAKEKS